jgi:hypothetical protein
MAAPSWASSAQSSLVSSPNTSSGELTLTLSPPEGLTGALFTGETNHYIYLFSTTEAETPPTQTFTVTNTGTSISQSLHETFGSTYGGLTVSHDNCSGTSLIPSTSCTFQLTAKESLFGLLEVRGSAGVEYIHLQVLA